VLIADRPVDTPTVARLKLLANGKSGRPYAFFLTDHDLTALRTAGLSLATAAAYACIRGAARAARDAEWVTLRPRTINAVGRDWRWWHDQTQRLQVAGFIEVQRHRGRLPRYRLAPPDREPA
jgi:hypothetical protein